MFTRVELSPEGFVKSAGGRQLPCGLRVMTESGDCVDLVNRQGDGMAFLWKKKAAGKCRFGNRQTPAAFMSDSRVNASIP
ncbi:hypothetical protein [Streptomyces sp. S1]|uniref:hypothetical protein n=1 Tax=Streptomyces sp. S1 TaxID=718288 RepID=UPI003D7108D3